MSRRASRERQTSETSVNVSVSLDDAGCGRMATGLPFFDHMLNTMQLAGGFSFAVEAQGDLSVDDHHLVEDCALTLGTALDAALGLRRGIVRTSSAYGLLDEALVRAVVDLSGRPFAAVRLDFRREQLGGFATENITHFFQSLAMRLGASIHVRCLAAENDHHRAEAAFKAVGMAIGQAMRLSGSDSVPSTKGTLTC